MQERSVFKWTFSILMFKSPIISKLLYLLEKWLRILTISLVNSRSLTTGGLYVLIKSHFRFIWQNSKSIFVYLDQGVEILMAYKKFLNEHIISGHLRTCYGDIWKLFIWNCFSVKVSPSLDSEIRNILKFSINPANISYLFQKKLILKWPIIAVLGSLKRWFLMLARLSADRSNRFENPK